MSSFRHFIAALIMAVFATPAFAQFEQIQLIPNTPDRQSAITGEGPSAIVQLPDGSLGVFYNVRTTISVFGPSELLFTSSSDGVTWSTPTPIDQSNDWSGIAVIQAAVDAQSDRILVSYVRDQVPYFIYSDDGGATWTKQSAPSNMLTVSAAFIEDLAPVVGGGFVALVHNFLDSTETIEMSTSSDGLTWDDPHEIARGSLCSGSISSLGSSAFLTLYNECYYGRDVPWPMLQQSSTDGGATWSAATEAFSSIASFGPRADMTRADDGTLWVVHTNSEDLFYTSSSDGGTTWATSQRWTDTQENVGDDFFPAITMYSGSPMVLFVARNGVRAGTQFEGLYYGIPGVSRDPLVTSIDVLSAEVPRSIVLDQNYPNPFNPQTTITFSVAETAQTRLTVVDLMGREVAVLVDGVIAPGSYQATFDGSSLSSGTYIYRLTSGQTRMQRLLTLLK